MSQTPDRFDERNDAAFLFPNAFDGQESNSAFARATPEASWIFGRQPQPPPFYPYFPRAPVPPQRVQSLSAPGNSSDVPSTCSNENRIRSYSTNIDENGASSTANTDRNGAKSSSKWGEAQTSVLVSEWKERIEEVESSRATEAWNKIVEAVNKAGSKKTTKQCKDKLRNLKKAYKDAKTNNKATGRPPQTSPYFDSFDEVLGTRAVVTMPGIIQSGQAIFGDSSSSSQDQSFNDSEESDQEYDRRDASDSELESSLNAGPRPKRKAPKKDQKKAKKGRITTASAMIDLTEKLVEMQNSQLKMMEKAQKRSEDLLIKLEADQRKLDEESRRRDQEFFLRMAEIMKR
ncbi:trihelix transcription factor GT-2-like [Dendronephthya gigantea]|uniref:trihelix transcription factor GT-2-like n=1 Tax=Dendronephthya gigantea TaxID=151771 RepID=UPI00106AC9F9|nr:trihelix transcription factor GT-2-like [Dendronephthya gigantea]